MNYVLGFIREHVKAAHEVEGVFEDEACKPSGSLIGDVLYSK